MRTTAIVLVVCLAGCATLPAQGSQDSQLWPPSKPEETTTTATTATTTQRPAYHPPERPGLFGTILRGVGNRASWGATSSATTAARGATTSPTANSILGGVVSDGMGYLRRCWNAPQTCTGGN